MSALTSTTGTQPMICHGNTLELGDLAVFVLRARHDWSGTLPLTRNLFPFCHHETLAFCLNGAKRRIKCTAVERVGALYCGGSESSPVAQAVGH